MIIEPLIGFWLIIGALFDYRFYKVPNFISYSIVALSVPVIIINHVWTQSISVLELKIFVILYLFVAWWFSNWISTKTKSEHAKWGAADTKVMAPILLMLPELSSIIFLSLMLITGIAIGLYLLITKHQQKIPGFVPITVAYWIAILL